MKIQVQVERCWLCEAGITVVEGRIQGEATFWTKNMTATVTAHHDDCQFRGKEVPEWTGHSNQYKLKRWWELKVRIIVSN